MANSLAGLMIFHTLISKCVFRYIAIMDLFQRRRQVNSAQKDNATLNNPPSNLMIPYDPFISYPLIVAKNSIPKNNIVVFFIMLPF